MNKGILLMGRSGSGKSSMRNMIFANYSAIDTRRLGATMDIQQSTIRLLNGLKFSLMDCGGQDNFMLDYIKSGSTKLNNAELLIYVFDIERTEEKDYGIFNLILNTLKNLSPNCRIFVLVHKMDLVDELRRDEVLNNFIVNVEKKTPNLQFFKQNEEHTITYAGTSIWDESLYQAWSNIVVSLIPETDNLHKHLKTLSTILNAETIMVFETSTFLSIATYPTELPNLNIITQKVSGIIKNYKKSMEKISARFKSLTLYADNKNIYLDNLTDTMVIMLVIPDNEINLQNLKSLKNTPNSSDPNLENNEIVDSLTEDYENFAVNITQEKYVQDVIKKVRRTFEKLDFGK